MIDQTFGFDTACTEATKAVNSAYVEAKGNAAWKMLGNTVSNDWLCCSFGPIDFEKNISIASKRAPQVQRTGVRCSAAYTIPNALEAS